MKNRQKPQHTNQLYDVQVDSLIHQYTRYHELQCYR